MNEQGDGTGSKIDLSSVPEPMRSMLLKQLARFPDGMREQLLREGSPLLDRVIAKARERAGVETAALPASAAESDPTHSGADRGNADRVQTVRNNSGAAAPLRVQTVSPGDSVNGGIWLVAFAIAAVVAGYFALRG